MTEREVSEVQEAQSERAPDELLVEWRRIDSKVTELNLEMNFLVEKVNKWKTRVSNDMSRQLTEARFRGYNEVELGDFLDTPYAIIPRGSERPNEWWVITPKFTNYELGYLDHSANGWHYFIVNKYMQWLARIPEELKDKFKFRKPLPLRVFDGVLLTGEEDQEEAWKRYRKHLYRKKGKDQIRISMGHEFELIASIIDDGMLPFMPQPIELEDLREPRVKFELRDYQASSGYDNEFRALEAGDSVHSNECFSAPKGREDADGPPH